MNDFNVLLAAATNGTPSGSLFDALFARYIAPQESWRELESPLPITILAAGEDLIDYRIFGNTENGESVGERTENLFDVKVEQGGWDAGNGVKPSKYGMEKPGFYYTRCRCDSIYATDPTKQYTISVFPKTFQVSVKQTGLTGVQIADTGWGNDWTVTGASGVCFSIKNPTNSEIIPSDIQGVTITEGSTAPTSYIPYGYKLPMVVTNGTTTTTTPIYIGSDPLAEDEYVDFGEQKIYRMEGGTLTPTDPPVPIPALPTIEGETIIDYNPSTTPAVEPEKMYIKYKPQ